MEPAKVFPIYQLQDAFEAFCNGEPAVKPQHRSLYYFLLGYCRRRGNTPRFSLTYEAGMHGSAIGSWATYDTAMKALAEWGFIIYTPGANRYKVPVVELTFRNPTDDVLLTYWQSYCLSTSNPTGDVPIDLLVTLKEDLNKGNKEERKDVRQPASQPARHFPPPPDDVQLFTAENWPGLVEPARFANICTTLGYPQVDFELYRLQITVSLEGKEMPAAALRNWIKTYLNNDKEGDKLLVPVVQTPNEIPSNWHGPGPYIPQLSGTIPNMSDLINPNWKPKP